MAVNPAMVPPDEFEGIVVGELAALPDWVRRAVQEVAFLVEDVPPAGAGPEHGLLLGQYHGVPLTRRGHRASGSLPDTIVLYRLPILRACRHVDQVQPRVRTVLLHEIGHALGLGEDRLRELGVG
jgi:predicted Zn-dependent protease with MMP-like domain